MTPSNRLARHLRWRVGIERKQTGASTWSTPDILALPQWLERCWEQSLVADGTAGQRVLLNAGQFRQVSRGIVDDLVAGRSLGVGVERLVREARVIAADWQIGVHDLRAAVAGPDTEFFAAWAERFAAICHEQRWVDAAGLPELLLPELGEGLKPTLQTIALAGFEYPTAAETRLFDRLEELHLLAGQIAAPAVDTPAGYRISCDDPASERRAAAHWARTRLAARPDSLIGIIVPGVARSAGAYRRSFLDVFDPLWRDRDGTLFPVAIADGAKLADAELVGTAQLLLRIPAGRLDYREVGRLLRSPYLGGWDTEADARARFDLRLRDDGLQQVNLRTLRKRFCKSDSSGPTIFLDGIDALLRQAEQIDRRHDPGSWVELFEQLLRAAQFCQGRTLSVRDETTLQDWSHAIERFASLGEVIGRVDYRHALTLLAETVRDQPLNRYERDDGVQIMTPADAVGMRFDALWLGGMTSAAWPGESRPSPLLPLALQRARGIPEAVPQLYRERALGDLRALFVAAPEYVASCPANDGEEALVASPHIAFLDLATPEQPGVASTTVSYRELQHHGTPLSHTEDPPPAVDEVETVRGGSRLLNLQSACPARAFFELRLGATEMVSPPFALDAATRGKIVHDTAEYFYAALRADGGPLAASVIRLEQEAAAAITRALDRHVPPMHPLAETLRKTERARLERLMCNLVERDRQRGLIDIVELEDRRDIEVGGLTLTVRFDRVDQSADGEQLVIDYKTGSKFGASKWLGERPLEMQLPLYAAYGDIDGISLYWLHAKGLGVTGTGIADWGINAAVTGRRKPFSVLSADGWQQQVADWRVTCEHLIGEFRAGDCRIDLELDNYAGGEYAMLTRRWALDPHDPESA